MRQTSTKTLTDISVARPLLNSGVDNPTVKFEDEEQERVTHHSMVAGAAGSQRCYGLRIVSSFDTACERAPVEPDSLVSFQFDFLDSNDRNENEKVQFLIRQDAVDALVELFSSTVELARKNGTLPALPEQRRTANAKAR